MKLTDKRIIEIAGEAVGLNREGYPCFEADVNEIVEFARAVLKEAGVEGLERGVPQDAIGRVLTEVMDAAVQNGADSRSMPDDYVAIAAWLCGVREPERAPVAWMTEREGDSSWPRLHETEADADYWVSFVKVKPFVTKRPLYFK